MQKKISKLALLLGLFLCLFFLLLTGVILKANSENNGSKETIRNLHYDLEIESVLKEKYFSMLELQILNQNTQIDSALTLFDEGNFRSSDLLNCIHPNELVFSVPENSCHDCVKKVVKGLKENINKNTEIVILSVFYNKDDFNRFRKMYGITNEKWRIFDVKSNYFWNLSDNKLLLFKINTKYKFKDFIPLDGEFNKLLYTYLKK